MKLPRLSNSMMGSSMLSAQLLAPQRSAIQRLPSLSEATALEEPIWRPAGSLKKLSIRRYGSGSDAENVSGASACDPVCDQTAVQASVATAQIAPNDRPWMRLLMGGQRITYVFA